ncbi:MAG: DUF4286 family protein [Daejeonella sp.]
MILYNVTVIIDEDIQQEWLNWMRETHIPDVMATELFVSNRILKVLDSPNEGITYCIQYIADSIEKYNEYKEKFSPKLQLEVSQKFDSKLVSFRTVMEFID